MALLGLGVLLNNRGNNRRRNEELNLIRRELRDASNPFQLTDFQFIRLFRTDKETARYLINRIQERLHPSRSDGLSPQMKVLITLRFLGFGSYQRIVGQGFYVSVSQPTVSRCIRYVTRAVYDEFLNETIKFPSSVEEREEVENRFRGPTGFPGVLGCIDCTHVGIVTPHVQEDVYKNHHGFYSLNVQMICDERLRILNVNANFPGSVHDQFVFNASLVKQEMIRLHRDRLGKYFLLGDSGYALEKYLLTPVLNALPNTAEERYTRRHCQVRNRIERVFGVLKARWRCLRRDRILHYQPESASRIVYACAILHNLLLDRIPLPDVEVYEELPNNRNDIGIGVHRDVDGRRMRDAIINTYFIDN